MDEGVEERYAVLSVCGSLGTLHLWQSRDGAPRRAQTGCRIAGSAAVAASRDGTRVLAAVTTAAGAATTLATFSVARAAGGPVHRCGAPETALSALAFSSDGAFIAGGGVSGRCYVWCASTGVMLASWDAHFQRVNRVVFSDDDEVLLTAGDDCAVLAFDFADVVDATRQRGVVIEPRVSFKGHTLPVKALSVGFAGASARVLTAAADRSARLWHLASGTCIGSVMLPCAATEAVLALDESAAYVGLVNGDVVAIDTALVPTDTPLSYRSLPTFRVSLAPGIAAPSVTAMDLSPDGTELVVGYADGLVRIYDTQSRILLYSYAKHSTTAAINCVRVLYPVPAAMLDNMGAGTDVSTAAVQQVQRQSSVAAPLSAAAQAAAALPMDVSYAKVVDPNLADTFTPLLPLAGTQDLCSAAWAVIDDALHASDAQRRTAVTEMGKGRVCARAPAQTEVPAAVAAELESLRKRNAELEAAGKQLVQLVGSAPL